MSHREATIALLNLHDAIDNVNETLIVGVGRRAELEDFTAAFDIADRPDDTVINDAATATGVAALALQG